MHNVDHVLLEQKLRSKGNLDLHQKQYQLLKDQESHLYRYSDGVFACSNEDLQKILEINDSEGYRGAVIPNGMRGEACVYDDSGTKHKSGNILFCGTLTYLPNIDGLNWFHSEIWPLVTQRKPDAKLIVVGRELNVEKFPKLSGDTTVELIGEVTDLTPYYHNAGVTICPVRMGSGTRLKILESMAFGNPMVSTTIGCQGIGAENEKHLLIRDSVDGFANGICNLMESEDSFKQIQRAARAFVHNSFDWTAIGSQMADCMDRWAYGNRQSA